MSLRIVPAHVAHSVSFAQPCTETLLFPGDGRPARCRLTVGDHAGGARFHEDTTGTRMWIHRSGDDYDVMMKPGSPALEASE